jgi:hypothetical protein
MSVVAENMLFTLQNGAKNVNARKNFVWSPRGIFSHKKISMKSKTLQDEFFISPGAVAFSDLLTQASHTFGPYFCVTWWKVVGVLIKDSSFLTS